MGKGTSSFLVKRLKVESLPSGSRMEDIQPNKKKSNVKETSYILNDCKQVKIIFSCCKLNQNIAQRHNESSILFDDDDDDDDDDEGNDDRPVKV